MASPLPLPLPLPASRGVQDLPSISYPAEFISRVRNEYAGDARVIKALDSGDYVLGKLLMERMDLDICPEQIVMAIEGGRSHEVLDEAKAAIRRTSIYLEWTRLAVHHVRSLEANRSVRTVP